MHYIKTLIISFLVLFNVSLSAEEAPANRYISDDLFIYFHSGPGTQYRILGSMDAGSQVTLTGSLENGFTEVIDDKQRKGWVDNKFLSERPGLRVVTAELNQRLQTSQQQLISAQTSLDEQGSIITSQEEKISELLNNNSALILANEELTEQLDKKGLTIKTTYFSYGAGAILIGLLCGLIAPRLIKPRRHHSSW